MLPPAARWSATWNAPAEAEIDRIVAAEAEDPESFEAAHRFTAGAPLELDPETDGRIHGYAPRRLAESTRHLEAAFRARRAPEIIAALAELSIAAADLADPYLTSATGDDEAPGAHAAFSDDLDGVVLEALDPMAGDAGSNPAAAGAALGISSAAVRVALEDAFRAGHDAQIASLRRERLAAALGLARAVALEAWRAAGSPVLDGAGSVMGAIDAWPSPARGAVTLGFTLPATGTTQLELYDVAGRRVWNRTVESRSTGPQRAILDAGTLDSLPAGVYLARAITGTHVATGRVIRIKE